MDPNEFLPVGVHSRFSAVRSANTQLAPACSLSQFVVTDLGLVIGSIIARLVINCDSIPIERLTLKSTV